MFMKADWHCIDPPLIDLWPLHILSYNDNSNVCDWSGSYITSYTVMTQLSQQNFFSLVSRGDSVNDKRQIE